MKQGIRRGLASLGVLLAVSSCTEIPVVPSRNSAGNPDPVATAAPPAEAPVDPATLVASLALSPETLELNSPHYTDETEMSDLSSPNSDGTFLEHESANFPTSALLAVAFRAAAGGPTPPAELVWISSNPQVAWVDEFGRVHAADTEVGGVATVTAFLRHNPQIRASVTVTVRNDGQLAIELK